MSDTVIASRTTSLSKASSSLSRRLFAGRQGRRLRESLTAYLFLLPAFLIIFVFGLFPLAFSAYESTLKGLNKVLGTYDGLGNYVKAMENLAYVLAFWIALTSVYLAGRALVSMRQTARKYEERPWAWLLPGAVTAAGLALLTRFVFVLLPELLSIPDKMRGQENTRQLFVQLIGESWRAPAVQDAWWLTLIVLAAGFVLAYLVSRYLSGGERRSTYYGATVQASLLLLGAAGFSWLTWDQIQAAYILALAEGQPLAIWSQLLTISAGFALLLLSWWLWRSASHRSSMISTLLRLGAAIILSVGAWVLIGELPRAVAAGDKDWWQGLVVTVYYAIGTIPFQFAISLLLATLLFQNIKGKGLFRMIYFLPYITPFVGTAAVFRILFSSRDNGPVNGLLGIMGIEPLKWLTEPTGVFQILAGANATLPDWAAGPSLSLVVIIFYGIWTFVGFDTVMFLAGLGSIPGELYEAASIDGAGRWAQFRHVTLPLLSPTLYFLSLWATIGTFKAFNHIYVLREAAALGTTDTASIVIFDAFKRDTRYGYASALAILLLIIILILTIINNRVASKRVFYG